MSKTCIVEYKYFGVEQLDKFPGKKTHEYHIRSYEYLGAIKWYPAWRKFCFFPADNTVWNNECLDDIKDAIIKITAIYKKEKK